MRKYLLLTGVLSITFRIISKQRFHSSTIQYLIVYSCSSVLHTQAHVFYSVFSKSVDDCNDGFNLRKDASSCSFATFILFMWFHKDFSYGCLEPLVHTVMLLMAIFSACCDYSQSGGVEESRSRHSLSSPTLQAALSDGRRGLCYPE